MHIILHTYSDVLYVIQHVAAHPEPSRRRPLSGFSRPPPPPAESSRASYEPGLRARQMPDFLRPLPPEGGRNSYARRSYRADAHSGKGSPLNFLDAGTSTSVTQADRIIYEASRASTDTLAMRPPTPLLEPPRIKCSQSPAPYSSVARPWQ